MQVMRYACKHPARVNGMVLLGTMASVSPAERLLFMARAIRRKDEPWFADAVKVLQAGPPKNDEEMAAGMQKLMPAYWADPARIEKHQDHFAATSMSAHAMQGAQESRSASFDLTAQLKTVTAPALIVAGDKDIFCPPAASRAIHLNLANSKLLVIEDCGHFMWLEQADEFNTQVPLFLQALGVRE